MKAPSAHLNVLRELHRGLTLRIDRKLAVGGRVSCFDADRNAQETESLNWAISTLDRLLKKAREARLAGQDAGRGGPRP